MPLSGTELDRIANDIVASDLTIRVHTGAPGNAGTANRANTTGLPQTLDAASWNQVSDGSGDVTYGAAVAFGVIDSANATTLTHYSIFRGAAFVASETLAASTTVPAGGVFQINSGTVRVNGSTS